jgi:hypothetical protein
LHWVGYSLSFSNSNLQWAFNFCLWWVVFNSRGSFSWLIIWRNLSWIKFHSFFLIHLWVSRFFNVLWLLSHLTLFNYETNVFIFLRWIRFGSSFQNRIVQVYIWKRNFHSLIWGLWCMMTNNFVDFYLVFYFVNKIIILLQLTQNHLVIDSFLGFWLSYNSLLWFILCSMLSVQECVLNN